MIIPIWAMRPYPPLNGSYSAGAYPPMQPPAMPLSAGYPLIHYPQYPGIRFILKIDFNFMIIIIIIFLIRKFLKNGIILYLKTFYFCWGRVTTNFYWAKLDVMNFILKKNPETCSFDFQATVPCLTPPLGKIYPWSRMVWVVSKLVRWVLNQCTIWDIRW